MDPMPVDLDFLAVKNDPLGSHAHETTPSCYFLLPSVPSFARLEHSVIEHTAN